jgi:hypothetical protein
MVSNVEGVVTFTLEKKDSIEISCEIHSFTLIIGCTVKCHVRLEIMLEIYKKFVFHSLKRFSFSIAFTPNKILETQIKGCTEF